jgi:hypothetical protein
LKTAHALRGKWVAPERYHATLHLLGDNSDLRPDLVDAAIAAATTVRICACSITRDGAWCVLMQSIFNQTVYRTLLNWRLGVAA